MSPERWKGVVGSERRSEVCARENDNIQPPCPLGSFRSDETTHQLTGAVACLPGPRVCDPQRPPIVRGVRAFRHASFSRVAAGHRPSSDWAGTHLITVVGFRSARAGVDMKSPAASCAARRLPKRACCSGALTHASSRKAARCSASGMSRAASNISRSVFGLSAMSDIQCGLVHKQTKRRSETIIVHVSRLMALYSQALA